VTQGASDFNQSRSHPAPSVWITGIGRVFPEPSHLRSLSREPSRETPMEMGRVEDAVLKEGVDDQALQALDRNTALAVVAARRALEHRGRAILAGAPDTGCCLGTTFGGIGSLEEFLTVLWEKGPRKVHPRALQMTISNAAASNLSIDLSFHGVTSTCSGGILSGLHALMHTVDSMSLGVFPSVMLAGGTESPDSAWVSRWCRLYGMDGIIRTEGAALAVLERSSPERPFDSRALARWVTHGGFHLPESVLEDSDKSTRTFRNLVLGVLDQSGLSIEDIHTAVAFGGSREVRARSLRRCLKALWNREPLDSHWESSEFAGAATAVNQLFRLVEEFPATGPSALPADRGTLLFAAVADDGDFCAIVLERVPAGTTVENV